MVGNAMSHSNIHSALHKALVEKLGQGIGKDPPSVWIVDVYDSFFVYEHEDEKRLFKLGFSSSDTGVEITGEPEEVLRVTEYRTVGGAFVGNSVDKEGETPSVANERRNKMEKDKLIEALIANARTKWSEEDREALTALEAAVLEKILPTEEEAEAEQNEAGEKPALEEKPAPEEKPVTMEQYVRNAPLEFRDVLTSGLAAHREQKDGLIAKITANKANQFSKEFLATKGMQELRGLAALAEANAPQANESNIIPMFAGASTLAGPVQNVEDEQPLTPPVMSFGTEG